MAEPLTYPLTVGGVPCLELSAESGRISLDLTPDAKNLAATQVYVCDWGNQLALCSALYFTTHPFISYCYALTFQVEPWGKPTAYHTWKQAKVTVGYKNLSYSPTDMKEIQVTASAENVTLQNDGMEFETGNTPEAKRVGPNPNAFVIFAQISVILHNQTSINESSWSTIIGKVNSGSWSPGSGFATWGEGQVLYQGYDITQKTTLGGATSYEVTHKFLGSPFNHNEEFNPHIGALDKVKAKVTGDYKYDEADFTGLVP